MKDLTTNLDDKVVKALQNKIDSYQAEIGELKEKLAKKEEEITILTDDKAGDLDKLNSEIYDLKKTITIQGDEIKRISAELDESKPKIAEMTKNNEEFKKVIDEKESKIKELSDALEEKEKEYNEQRSKLEELETELSAFKPAEPSEYTSDERLVCLSCGAKGKDLKVEEDKSKVLGYLGHTPMYAKIHVCKKCGYKF
jgi:chromosome segregation ATPase